MVQPLQPPPLRWTRRLALALCLMLSLPALAPADAEGATRRHVKVKVKKVVFVRKTKKLVRRRVAKPKRSAHVRTAAMLPLVPEEEPLLLDFVVTRKRKVSR